MNIILIGYGRIGKTFFNIFFKKRYNVFFFDKKIKNSFQNLAKIKNADFVFFCLPTKALREFLKENKKYFSPNCILITVLKGIEEKTKKLPFEILKEFLPENKIAVLGGALMAEELNQNKKTIAFVATENKKIFRKIEQLFKKSNIKILEFEDKKALNLIGVLKNVYTLFLSYIDSLNLGLNLKSYYLALSLKEIEHIILNLTKKQKIKNLQLAILSDLIVTNFSFYSNNRKQALIFLKKKNNFKETEGFYSLKTILQLIKNKEKYFILNLIEKIFLKKENVKKLIY